MVTTTRRGLLLGAAGAVVTACAAPPARPPLRTAQRPVIVVGAGLAGLATALALADAGRDVVVLEAQQRPGGRILTLRAPFDEGLYVEAGATHVVGDPDLLALCERVGVPLVRPQAPRGLATVVVRAGRRERFAADEDAPAGEPLSAEETALGFRGCLDRYFADVRGVDPALAWPPPTLAEHDTQTGAALLTARGASAGYLQGFGFRGEGLARMSAAFMLREVAGFFRDVAQVGGGRVAGGSDRLPIALARRLGDRVRYGAEVKSIRHDAGGVRVGFVENGRTTQLAGDRLVCALPYSVLRHLAITPAFSPRKTRAIQELRMVSVARVLAQVDRRIWLERGEGGDADTDLATGVLRDETKLQPGTAGILGVYASGDRARALTALPAEQRVAAVLANAELVHPGARAHFVRGAMHCWDEDPHARGAYAWFAPGEMTTLGPAVSSAEGRVHFAGDHTSARPGWMHGALASARRAAHEVLTARDEGT
jgi:monoamine oxidase